MQINTTGKHAGRVRLNQTERRTLESAAILLQSVAPHVDGLIEFDARGGAEIIKAVLRYTEASQRVEQTTEA